MTFVCLASGPSLTQEDVDYCRGKARVIAVNNTYTLAPWADILYAGDFRWWAHYRPEFAGEKWTASPRAARDFDLRLVKSQEGTGLCQIPGTINNGGNSGYQAIGLAHVLGAKRIILLGFDFHGGGHFHPAHPGQMNGAGNWEHRRAAMGQLAYGLKRAGVRVINCTRNSALTCFPLAGLHESLQPAAPDAAL